MKNYDDLTITDSYMFYRIMRANVDVCKEFIQRLVDIKISKIEYLNAEETIELDFDKRGIRLDVYLESSDQVFDIEVQLYTMKNLELRKRYYQSLIDLNCLEKGQKEDKLKQSYILFLTNEDYYGKELPCYTLVTKVVEDPSIQINDKMYKLVYNFNKYKEITDSQKSNLLKYLCTKQTNDDFTSKLDSLVERAKKNEPWRKEFMTWEMMKQDIAEMNLEQGIAIGEERGAYNTKIETAKKMLKDNMSVEMIVKYSGLTEEEVLALKQ